MERLHDEASPDRSVQAELTPVIVGEKGGSLSGAVDER